MSILRSQVIEEAKKNRICTQCLRNKAAKDRFQCQACIERCRNKRKKNIEKYRAYGKLSYERRKKKMAMQHTPESKAKISEAQRKLWAERKAIANADPNKPKRKWERRLPVLNELQLATLGNALEKFIHASQSMTHWTYLAERDMFIRRFIQLLHDAKVMSND